MPRFETMDVTDSPLVWTSVATGRVPEDHGIDDYVETLPSGKVIPITSNSRKVKSIWNIATEHGRTVGVLGWWASWPAEEVAGYVITNHANPSTRAEWKNEGTWEVSEEILAGLESDFLPADLRPILDGFWIDEEGFPFEEFQRRSDLSPEQMRMLELAPWYAWTPYSRLKTFFAIDYPMFRLAQRLAAERPTDLQMLYMRGPDPVQHQAWNLVEPEKYSWKALNLERDTGLVEGIYRYLDTFLGEILDSIDPNTILIVASDHGAEPTTQAHLERKRPGAHTVNAKGVLFLYGPHVKKGHELERGSPLDLMPTMAWLLGLPLASDLEGTVLTGAFEDDFVATHPVTTVDTYGTRETGPGLPSPSDEVLLDQLRSLGYIQ
jgi:hypothetical protein